MFKTVNVHAVSPVFGIKGKPMISGSVYKIDLSVGDILLCINQRARVEEVLEGGALVFLNNRNYNKDNTSKVKVVPVSIIEEPKVEIEEPIVVQTIEEEVLEIPSEESIHHEMIDELEESKETPKNKQKNKHNKNRR